MLRKTRLKGFSRDAPEATSRSVGRGIKPILREKPNDSQIGDSILVTAFAGLTLVERFPTVHASGLLGEVNGWNGWDSGTVHPGP